MIFFFFFFFQIILLSLQLISINKIKFSCQWKRSFLSRVFSSISSKNYSSFILLSSWRRHHKCDRIISWNKFPSTLSLLFRSSVRCTGQNHLSLSLSLALSLGHRTWLPVEPWRPPDNPELPVAVAPCGTIPQFASLSLAIHTVDPLFANVGWRLPKTTELTRVRTTGVSLAIRGVEGSEGG